MVKGLPPSSFNSVSGIAARSSSGALRSIDGKPNDNKPLSQKNDVSRDTAQKSPFQAALERRAQQEKTPSKAQPRLADSSQKNKVEPGKKEASKSEEPDSLRTEGAKPSHLKLVAPSSVNRTANNQDEKTVQVGELIEDFVEEMSEKYQLSPSLVAHSLDLSDPMKFFLDPAQAAQGIVGQLGLEGEQKSQAQALTETLFDNLKNTLSGLTPNDSPDTSFQNTLSGVPGGLTQAQLEAMGAEVPTGAADISTAGSVPKGSNGIQNTNDLLSALSKRMDSGFLDIQSENLAGSAKTNELKDGLFSKQSLDNSMSASQSENLAKTAVGLDAAKTMNRLNEDGSFQGVNQNFKMNGQQTAGQSVNPLLAGASGFQSTETMLNAMGLDQMARQYAQGSNQKMGVQKAGASYGFSSVKQSAEDDSSLINLSASGSESGVEDFEKESNLDSWLEQNSEQANQFAGQNVGQQGIVSDQSDFDKLLTNAGVSPEHRSENMENMVESAKLMTTKGGGSMDVELRPEGLGKVQLKVTVEGDQVQIQMVADSKQSQALLKDGLEELKAQLAGQKINVDSIKVDLSQDLSRQQDFAQGGREQQRHAGQDMMQQYRDERSQARQGWEPRSNRAATQNNSARIDNQPAQARVRSFDGRLNVVA